MVRRSRGSNGQGKERIPWTLNTQLYETGPYRDPQRCQTGHRILFWQALKSVFPVRSGLFERSREAPHGVFWGVVMTSRDEGYGTGLLERPLAVRRRIPSAGVPRSLAALPTLDAALQSTR